MNDKTLGMVCVTIMFLSLVLSSAITGKPIDVVLKELGGMIVTGIMGTMIGYNLKKEI